MLQRDAKLYDAKQSKDFTGFLTKLKEEWVKEFKEDWSFSSETRNQGLTIEALKQVEIIARYWKKKDDDSYDKFKPALNKALSQAYEDSNKMFILTKNAHELDNLAMNLGLLKIFNASKDPLLDSD